MAGVFGSTQVALTGNVVAISDFGVLQTLLEFALETFDPSVVRLSPGQLAITIPPNVNPLHFDDLAIFPSNKAIDILIFLTLPERMRQAVSTIRLAGSPVVNEELRNLIHKQRSIAAGFLMNYLLHGTPRQVESDPPQIAKFILDSTGLEAEEFALPVITSLPSLTGYRSSALVNNAIMILSQGSRTFKSRVRKGFGGNRVFSIGKALRKKYPAISSGKPEVDFFFSAAHDGVAPYVTFHPDHPLNPMGDGAQTVFYEFGRAYEAIGGNIDDLAKEAKSLFIKGIIERMKVSSLIVPGTLPSIIALGTATQAQYSLQMHVV